MARLVDESWVALARRPTAVEHPELHGGEPEHEAEDDERAVDDHVQIGRHADGHEEQPQQQAFERLDVRLELVAVLRIGQENAREKRAEGHREADFLHRERGADHDQERPGRRQLVAFGRGDHAEHGPQQVATDEHEADDRPEGDGHAHRSALGRRRRAGANREERHHGEHRDGREILKQEDTEGFLAVLRGELVFLAEELHRKRRRRERETEARHEGSRG
jgi:hypothetical protein